jgi:hypothetical protein
MTIPLYRGLSEETWARRFVEAGWPEEAARKMAAFLVGKEQTPPKWVEVTNE